MRILLVEDTAGLGEAVREQVVSDGHAVDWVQRLASAESAVRTTAYDLLLLDLLLPDGQGLQLLRQMRKNGDVTPVIILTARDQISDRIAGLNAGADDYLVKPFDLTELSARIAAVARRYHENPGPLVHIADLEVDLTQHVLRRAGQPVALTAREWALFEALVQKPGALLSKDRLEDHLYAFGDEVESNTIEVYVSRLRKKIGRDNIETVRGMGYRLRANSSWQE